MSALGLADYGSSDEEDNVVAAPVAVAKAADDRVNVSVHGNDKGKEPAHNIQLETRLEKTDNAAPIGPALGPAPGPAAMPADLGSEVGEEDGQPPASPYTANRALLRNLTMPPIPNFDIPPSPPGSPLPATTAKFDRFLELKKKGVHFNERLHQSSALRNPSLLAKLIDFAGISQEDQYASALPDAVAVPTNFPDWAYADKLVKEHERITKKKEDERARIQREAIDFVPAKSVDSDMSMRPASSTAGAPRSVDKSVGRSDKAESKRSRFDERDRRESSRPDNRDRRHGQDSQRRRSRSPR